MHLWGGTSRRAPAVLALIATLALALSSAAVAHAERSLYVSNFGSDQLSGFAVAPDGSLTPLPGLPLGTADGPGGVAMTPDGQRLYVASRLGGGAVNGFDVAADGTLTPIPGSPFAASAVDDLVISSDGSSLYLAGALIDGIYGFRIAADGSLTPVPGSPFLDGETSTALALSPDGSHLFITNIDAGEVAAFAVAADGGLTAAGPPQATGDQPTGIAVTPDGKRLYVASHGSNAIAGFEIAADGSLSPHPGSPFAANFGPQGIAITPAGRRLYASSFFFGIFAFGIGVDGTLSPVFGSPFAADLDQPLGLAAGTSENQLYMAGSESDDVAAFGLAPDGAPMLIGAPVPTGGSGPGLNSLAVTPNQGPVAALEASPPTGGAVSFDAGGSLDPDRTIARYDWDFGDGATLSTAGPTVSHTYPAGTYTATVTVTDDEGCSARPIYTGRSALCNASPQATAGRQVTVAASPSSSSQIDHDVSIQINGKKLRLSRRGRARAQLTCPATEASGPCQGKLVLKTRRKLGLRGKRQGVTLASADFRIPTGATRAVELELSPARTKLIRVSRRARAVNATGTVRDQAGNQAPVMRKMRLVPPRPKRR